jgi:hypothetical protein
MLRRLLVLLLAMPLQLLVDGADDVDNAKA